VRRFTESGGATAHFWAYDQTGVLDKAPEERTWKLRISTDRKIATTCTWDRLCDTPLIM